jgi:hypothetical protein
MVSFRFIVLPGGAALAVPPGTGGNLSGRPGRGKPGDAGREQ